MRKHERPPRDRSPAVLLAARALVLAHKALMLLPMFTVSELQAEHARAMRIVKAVLAACDPRAATARAAHEQGMARGDAPWVLAIGKAAIGMAEGVAEVCGRPRRHLIVTVEGPPIGSLPDVLRSDHPLPTQRSLDAGRAVRRFLEEAKVAGAPSLTVLVSGGASSLICEPIPGVELKEYRAAVAAMLAAGWDIQRMNTVRRAIDELKGGGLSLLAGPIPVSLLVLSDVMGNTLHDIGSGPFASSPTTPDDARNLLARGPVFPERDALLVALSCRPIAESSAGPERALVVADNRTAVHAAVRAAADEGLRVVGDRSDPGLDLDGAVQSVVDRIEAMRPGEAACWGGEWSMSDWTGAGFGGRAQALAFRVASVERLKRMPFVCLSLATDGVDGRQLPGREPAAGAVVWSGMNMLDQGEVQRALGIPEQACDTPDERDAWYEWPQLNSGCMFAGRDLLRAPGEPAAQLVTGATGTNVNDLLIAWRIR